MQKHLLDTNKGTWFRLLGAHVRHGLSRHDGHRGHWSPGTGRHVLAAATELLPTAALEGNVGKQLLPQSLPSPSRAGRPPREPASPGRAPGWGPGGFRSGKGRAEACHQQPRDAQEKKGQRQHLRALRSQAQHGAVCYWMLRMLEDNSKMVEAWTNVSAAPCLWWQI